MYCSRCGTSLPAGTAFCTSCGAPVANLGPPSVAASPVGAPVAAYPQPGAIGSPPGAFAAVVAPAVPYAGFWLRAVAYLLDSLIVGVVAVPIIISLAALTGVSATIQALSQDNAEQALAAASVVMFLVVLVVVVLCGLWLYYALTESSSWQGTLGKKAFGLIVTDMNGQRISFARATGRFFARIITGLVPLLIGYILAGITAKKQALHDMIAGTLVLRKA